MRDISKKAKEKLVLNMLATDNLFLEWAIAIIYARQTHDERATSRTRYVNQIGFNRVDALPLSTLANKVKKGQHLTAQEAREALNRMRKYVGQLIQAPELRRVFWQSTVTGEIIRETQKALQIQIVEGTNPLWIPKSVICSNYVGRGGQPFLIESWFVEKEIAGVITGTVLRETDQAICIKEEGRDGERWVPRSVIYSTYGSEPPQAFLVAKWFLERRTNNERSAPSEGCTNISS